MTAKRLVLLMTTAVCAGCDTLSPDDCRRARPTISVSAGATPEFNWRPECPIAGMQVGFGTWDINTINDYVNDIRPPIRYGTVPAGARANGPAPTLEAGVQYNVYLLRWQTLSDGGSALVVWAETSFVR